MLTQTDEPPGEFDDVQRVALATGRLPADIYQLALGAAERQ